MVPSLGFTGDCEPPANVVFVAIASQVNVTFALENDVTTLSLESLATTTTLNESPATGVAVEGSRVNFVAPPLFTVTRTLALVRVLFVP